MLPAGSNVPPTVSPIAPGCSLITGLGEASFSVNKVIAGSTCELRIEDAQAVVVWQRNFTANVASYTATGLPNGVLTLYADNGEVAAIRVFEINCTGRPPVAPVRVYHLLTAAVVSPPRVYHLQTGGRPVRRYRLSVGRAARVYHLKTHAALPSVPRRYRLLTSKAVRRYRLQVQAELEEGQFDIQITPDGNYLVVTIPFPTTALLPGRPPTVKGVCWDDTPYDGVLQAVPASADVRQWQYYIGPLDTDGVYRVQVLGRPNATPAGREDKVLVCLRLQLEHARQLLNTSAHNNTPVDYDKAADELLLWIGAAALAFEIKAYDECHYILSDFYALLVADY